MVIHLKKIKYTIRGLLISVIGLLIGCISLLVGNIMQNKQIVELNSRCDALEKQLEEYSAEENNSNKELESDITDVKIRVSNSEILIDELYDRLYKGKDDIRTYTEEW
jgi:hypothetical protein